MTFKDALKTSLLGWTAPVQAGPLQGFRWVKVSGSKFVKGSPTSADPEIFAAPGAG